MKEKIEEIIGIETRMNNGTGKWNLMAGDFENANQARTIAEDRQRDNSEWEYRVVLVKRVIKTTVLSTLKHYWENNCHD